MKALARAHRWQRLLEGGECASITEFAAAEKIDRSYLCRVLRLTLLAPELVEAIMDGRQPEELTLPGLMKGLEVEWRGSESGAAFHPIERRTSTPPLSPAAPLRTGVEPIADLALACPKVGHAPTADVRGDREDGRLVTKSPTS